MSLIKALTRLTLQVPSTRNIFTTSKVQFHITPILLAEPLKKKKKLDPQVVKQREERKRKKLEKQIRRLEKNQRQLKPIDELEVPLELLDEKNQRTRKLVKLSPEILEKRAVLEKQWARYKLDQKIADFKMIDSIMRSQQKALDELRMESEELYQEAIKPDMHLLPFNSAGPVSTPPIDNYESPDGEYINITKKFD